MRLVFDTFDIEAFADNLIIDKYLQTYKDYLWWANMRIKKSYDLIHAHHPIAALAMKTLFPDTPVIITIHSSYEKELVLNGRIQAGGLEEKFLTSLYRELEAKLDRIVTVSHSFRQYLASYVQYPDRIDCYPQWL